MQTRGAGRFGIAGRATAASLLLACAIGLLLPACRLPFRRGTLSAFFNAKGVRIHYLVQGSGEPVALIHGLYSSAALNWELPGIMAALARDHRVVAFDLPGHGGSDKPGSAEAYGNQMAEDVLLLMDHLNVGKAQVVGYSLGGIVALNVIAAHPDRVRSGLLGGMGWLQEGGAMQKVWEHLPMRRRGPTPEVCVHSISQLALTESAVREIKTPVEIVIGDRDPVRQLYVAPLQTVREDWPVIEISGAGHIRCVTKPQFLDEISRWLKRNA